MRVVFSLLVINILLLVSCSKSDDSEPSPSPPPPTPIIGPLDKTDGDLLVKIVRASGTNDTQVIKFKWDANNRLVGLTDSGKLNGGRINNKYEITRLIDGKIKRIVSRSANAAPVVDSIVYDVQYYAVGSRFFYVIASYFGTLPFNKDSITFGYNSSGRIISKETFNNFSGTMNSTFRENYTYDVQGNMIESKYFQKNGAGVYYLWNTNVTTFNTQNSPVQLGDVSFIVYGITVSQNATINSTSYTTSGSTTSITEASYSNYLYNSYNRPYQLTLTLTPQPPGFTSKLLYFYQ